MKEQARSNEVKSLLQGIPLPTPDLTAKQPLPLAKERASHPVSQPTHPLVFEEPEDNTGLAKIRKHPSTQQSQADSNYIQQNPPCDDENIAAAGPSVVNISYLKFNQ